ncbi:immunoglobulin-like domain-containing protein [Listeria fleischmannii]|nr:immunoglobulin-like domain-containing protein [Listeria fleischmannii]
MARTKVTLTKEVPNTVGTVTANPFAIGQDSYVKGSFTGDVAKISMVVNGQTFTSIPVTGGMYQYYASGKISSVNDSVTMIAYDAKGKELDRASVTVQKK